VDHLRRVSRKPFPPAGEAAVQLDRVAESSRAEQDGKAGGRRPRRSNSSHARFMRWYRKRSSCQALPLAPSLALTPSASGQFHFGGPLRGRRRRTQTFRAPLLSRGLLLTTLLLWSPFSPDLQAPSRLSTRSPPNTMPSPSSTAVTLVSTVRLSSSFPVYGRSLILVTRRALFSRLYLGPHPPSPRPVLLLNHPSVSLATPRTQRLSAPTPRASRPRAQPQGFRLGRLLWPLRVPKTPFGRPRPQRPRLHRLGSMRGCRHP
jgi:hypothetical protein